MSFSNPAAVARYADGPVRQVPGLHALHRMTELLLAEQVADTGRVLVLGAGGGLELNVFAQAHPGWQLLGVDPSAPMLALAQQTLGPLADRVELLEGTIDNAPETVFDGATCLLTLHFLSLPQRLHALRETRRRLKPAAPLIVAHHSFAQSDPEKSRWLQRYAAFAVSSGVAAADANRAIDAFDAHLHLLWPDDEVAMLRQAGFESVELFYAAFTFKGWVAYAP